MDRLTVARPGWLDWRWALAVLDREARVPGEVVSLARHSASLLTESINGKTREEAEAIFKKFHALVTGHPVAEGTGPALGKLEVFAGVSEYPARVNCASLAWHTLHQALSEGEKAEPVSTE